MGIGLCCRAYVHTMAEEVLPPLKVRIVFGDTNIDQVLADIVAPTKLNFNSCIFADDSCHVALRR